MASSNKCDHCFPTNKSLTNLSSPDGKKVRAVCGVCMKLGPFSEISWGDAVQKFWEQEKSMSNEDYKRGVKEALDLPISGGWYSAERVKNIIEDRLRTLLGPPKKVTKWVIVLPAPMHGEEYISQGRLWDSKEAAEKFSKLYYVKNVGIFPIEIEVEI